MHSAKTVGTAQRAPLPTLRTYSLRSKKNKTPGEVLMPMIDADGCLLNVSVEGRDGGPTLMLSNSLGCTLQMWELQMKGLTQLFRVIRYDRRGHGKSGVPSGPYSMERL